MKPIEISSEEFIRLPTGKIAQIVTQQGNPKAGIFVPDGNRRMTLALSKLNPTKDVFYSENAHLTTQYFRRNLELFFNHGLPTLFVPLISPTVLKRSRRYLAMTLLEGLKIIFQSQRWLDFYTEHDIRISFYGDLKYLTEAGCDQVIDWIAKAKDFTAGHKSHRLFYGIASPNRVGTELARLAIDFYKLHGREPTYQEQVKMYYGESAAPADFFIMSTKLAGLGALPPLISGAETQMYFLIAPGVMALTQETYRKILYDLIFCRPIKSREEYSAVDLQEVELLSDYYSQQKSKVIGLGKKIGKFWVPDI